MLCLSDDVGPVVGFLEKSIKQLPAVTLESDIAIIASTTLWKICGCVMDLKTLSSPPD